jgi:hypothetical protein
MKLLELPEQDVWQEWQSMASQVYAEPSSTAYEEMREILFQAGCARGVDYDGGRFAHLWPKEGGLELVHAAAYHPHYLPGPYKILELDDAERHGAAGGGRDPDSPAMGGTGGGWQKPMILPTRSWRTAGCTSQSHFGQQKEAHFISCWYLFDHESAVADDSFLHGNKPSRRAPAGALNS